MQKYLRPEARPADWNSLDMVQQGALGSVAKMIGEAIDGLPEEPLSSYYGPEKLHSLAGSERASRILFVSGARGTGKTTVLVTLIQASIKGSLDGLDDEEVKKSIEKMHKHVVWLEPLDMEPLPKNSNLLGTILARIDAAIRTDSLASIGSAIERDTEYRPRRLFEPSTDYHDSMLKLQRLQTDIAIAWDGNIQSREGHLDPDAFALEMMRSEQSRLHINTKFQQVLDLLSSKALQNRGKGGAIFILPVDDLDLNPSSCLILLNLLRLISVPRLFTIVLGDLDLAGVVLALKFSSDLANVAKGAESMHQVAISKAAANISSNSLRKLIPSNQRLNLAPMNTWESLGFRPLGSPKSECTIYTLLKKFPLTLKRPFAEEQGDQEEMKIDNMAAFLLFKGLSVLDESGGMSGNAKGDADSDTDSDKISKANVDEAVYNGIDFLNATPRELADIWFGLKTGIEDITSQNGSDVESDLIANPAEHVYSLLANQIKDKLFEEFTYQAREAIKQAIRKTPKGDWELGKLPLQIVAESEHIQTIDQELDTIHISPTTDADPNVTKDYEPRISLRLPKGWRFEKEWSIDKVESKEKLKKNAELDYTVKIPVGTSSAIMLFHDLLAMSEGNDEFRSTLFIPAEMKLNWVVTGWHLGEYLSAELVWPSPPCESFWEYDVFIHPWKKALQQITQISPTSEGSQSFTIDSLFFVWLSAGTSMIDRKKPVTISTLYTTDWPNLLSRLMGLAGDYGISPNKQEILDWLVNVALLIMPESGLPEHCRTPFVNAAPLTQFWQDQKLLIAQKRAQRLALLVKEGMADLAQQLIIQTPQWFDYAIRPEESLIYRYAGVELEEEEREKKRSREIATLVERRMSEQNKELSSMISSLSTEVTTLKEDFRKLQSARPKTPTKAVSKSARSKARPSQGKTKKK